MRVVTIARKPCKGSMTNNVLLHGCGAINIDRTRISSTDNMSWAQEEPRSDGGRWPANLILQHKPGCTRAGKRRVEGYSINTWTDGAKPFGGGAGHEYETRVTPDEEVDVWECAQDCPVRALDEQSGYLKTGKVASHSNAGLHGWRSGQDVDYADTEEGGGASRFFCQIQAEGNLWDYLMALIRPPDHFEPVTLAEPSFGLDVQEWVWKHLPDESLHGIILEGDVSDQADELLRVLKPGAHCLVLSTKEEPTGWRTACTLEEAGFEMRDTICLLDDAADGVHYVTKAGTKERNAGLSGDVANKHETVKPIAVMEAVLADLPQDAVVADPFMGTGTTGIACLKRQLSFIGIERDESSFKVAHDRIRYWDGAHASWQGAEIESDLESDDSPQAMSLGDLFDDV